MVTFTQIDDSRLYQAATGAGDAGWLGLVLPADVKPPAPTLSFEEALTGKALGASFIFALQEPAFDGANTADAFIQAIYKVIEASISNRNFIWLPGKAWQLDFAGIPALKPPQMPISDNGSSLVANLTVAFSDALKFVATAGDSLDYDADTARLTLSNDRGATQLTGPSAPQYTAADTAVIDLLGAHRGRLQTEMSLQRSDMLDELGWGLQYYAPATGSATFKYMDTYAPFASGELPNPTDRLSFTVRVDPRDPNNAWDPDHTASAFYFSAEVVLVSCFRTHYGHTIELLPVTAQNADSDAHAARFTVAPGEHTQERVRDFSFSPGGDFIMQMAADTPDAPLYFLQCSLAGVENIGFLPKTDSFPGFRLRFVPGNPANAPVFPIPESSPVGPPIKTAAPLLDGTFHTSWMTVLPAGNITAAPYVAQPKGANLFSKGSAPPGLAADPVAVLDPADPAVSLPSDPFPMIPYAGVKPSAIDISMSADSVELFEQQVLSPTRRVTIGGTPARMHASARKALDLNPAPDSGATVADGTTNLTTPSGVIAGVDSATGQWQSITLGKNFDPKERTMGFFQPNEFLQQAFQTSDLFLVAANPANLGAYDSLYCALQGTGEARFENSMNVEDWVMAAAVGRGNAYNDYRNIFIVKGTKGRLVDLVQSPNKWTQKGDFSEPAALQCSRSQPSTTPTCTEAAGDSGQLVILAQWFSDYFDAALAQDNDYFRHFNQIIQDANWTGILVLKADITRVPTSLAGITQGVELDQFYAHHFGINISPVNGADVDITESSSVFGLIYYVDPTFDDQAVPPRPVAAPPNVDWDFKVLSLKTLFENTAVKKFESCAQITLNTLFSDQVTSLTVLDAAGGVTDDGDNFNSLLLKGAYQHNGGSPVYSLASVNTGIYSLRGKVLPRVEIDTAQMSILDDGLKTGQVVSWIGMTGYMNFADMGQPGQPFDVFSYGSDTVGDTPRQGLAFRQLGLSLAHPLNAPAQGKIDLVSAQLAFDQASSSFRDKSLVRNFALTVKEFITSDATNPPSKLGYLGVIADGGLAGLGTGVWNGLVLRVNLGTPGALAGKVGLNSDLLLAWAPGTAPADDRVSNDGGKPDAYTYHAQIGLSLPGSSGGAPLISLQTVMKLSIGMIRLLYVDDASKGQTGFLLQFTDIALKFLGLLKIPPNGSTAFYLFGNDKPGGTDNDGVGWYAIYNQDKPKPGR